jgi:predicted nucleic acid-binding Zn ribbon protein
VRHRRAPRGAGSVIERFAGALAPATLLADVQRVWPVVAGPVIGAQATPTAARDGVVTVSATTAVWAQELDLMSEELVARLNAQLGASTVRSVRVQATPARGWSRGPR